MKKILILAIALLVSFGATAQTPKGTLVIVGGGKRTPAIMQKFFAAGGGQQGKYLVITTACHKTCKIDGEEAVEEYAGYGVNDVKWVAPTRKQADDPAFVDKWLDGVTGVFFTGGLQRRIVDTLRGTEMHKRLMSMYENDGIVIGGTSAGAGMMPDPMIAGNRKVRKDNAPDNDKKTGVKSIRPRNARITPGMGFLKNAIIDQHFLARSRENRLFSAALDMPQVTAFGIDEATAMVVTGGNQVEIVGESSVMVIEVDAATIKKDDNGDYGCSGMTVRLLLSGDKYVIPEK